MTRLFDTRGGTTMIDRCEACHDELEDDNPGPVCTGCANAPEEDE